MTGKWVTKSYVKRLILRIHWRLLKILKTSENVYEVHVYWFRKVYIYWNCIQYITHWDKTQILKKLPSDEINGTKNAVSFLSRSPTHHNFILNLRFSYELKHKVYLSKTVRGIFHFWFFFIFIKVYIFVQQNAWTLQL